MMVVFGLISCNTPKEKLEKKLMSTINDYMEINKGKEDNIDSIVIKDIDTLTPATYLFLYQQSLQIKAESIGQQYAAATEDGEEKKGEALDKENVRVLNKLDSCTRAMESPNVDKSTVWGYFVITKIYIKHPDNTCEIMDIGFPVTKDYKVYEMEL